MKITKHPAFRSPDPSRATRTVAMQSTASMRGTVVAKLSSEGHPRTFVYESKLEQSFFFIAATRPDVLDIWEQPSAISFFDGDGKRRLHTFDFLVTFKCGKRVAVIVKPAKYAKRCTFQQEVKLIAAATPATFADSVVVVTDLSFTRAEALTAKRIFAALQRPDAALDRKVLGAIKDIEGKMSIRSFLEQIGLTGKGYACILRAIGRGVLRISDQAAVSPETMIVAGDVK